MPSSTSVFIAFYKKSFVHDDVHTSSLRCGLSCSLADRLKAFKTLEDRTHRHRRAATWGGLKGVL